MKYTLIFFIFYKCNVKSAYSIDIYGYASKGDTLQFDLFKFAQRIIKTDKWYFVYLDLYKTDINRNAPHILVCDHQFVIKGASGCIPKLLDAKYDTIFVLNEKQYKNYIEFNKLNRASLKFVNDLPKNINIQFKSRNKKFNGFGRYVQFNLIDSIQILKHTDKVRIYYKYTDSSFDIPSWTEFYKNPNYYNKNFNKSQHIDISINELWIGKEKTELYLIKENDIIFEMIVVNPKLIDQFLQKIYFNYKNNI